MKPLLCSLCFCCLLLIALNSSAQPVDTAQLVVHADMPHFLHEGDRMEMTVRLTNKTGNEITGQAVLQLVDAASGTPVDGWFQNVFPAQYFTIEGGKTAVVPFPIEVPHLFKKALAWRVTAAAQHLTGSDEGLLPVLTTKALRTETVSLPINESGTTSFTFQKLVQSDANTEHLSLTVEAVFNPLWPVIQALPHLTAAPPETTEALWYSLYASALAAKIRTTPEWKQAVTYFSSQDTSIAALFLKHKKAASLIEAQMPWAVEPATWTPDAQNPFLMDAGTLQKEITRGLVRLKEQQQKNGGFAWVNGGPEDRYITGCIVMGMGFLKSLIAFPDEEKSGINTILKPALAYLDKQLEADFSAFHKTKKQDPQGINPLQVQYLYLRSFFADHSIPASTLPAYQHYMRQAQRQWQTKSPLLQSMIALALHRQGDKKEAQVILQQLKRTAINNTASNKTAFGWWQAPAETTALLLEAFHEVTGDAQIKNKLISGLLQQRKSDTWQTRKASAHACYALLMMRALPPNREPLLQVQLGDTRFSNNNKDPEQRGFFRQHIYPPLLQPQSGRIQVTAHPAVSASSKLPFWITASWRYFAEPNVSATSPKVTIQKKLFLKSSSSKHSKQDNNFHTGDTIQVQLTFTTDRTLEYVHIKDVHAAAMKPVVRAAAYHTDAATHFYLPAVSKGTTVLQYAVIATRAGTFSTGLATVESGHLSNLVAWHNAVRIQIE